MDRRQFLQALGALGATGAGLIGVASGAQASDAGAADGAGRLPLTKKRRPAQPAVRDVDGLPVAEWVVEENRRPGTLDWVIHPVALPAGALPGYGTGVEGYVDKVSYQAGDILTLYASCDAPHFRADIYRIGYYGGAGARHVHSTQELPGVVQPVPAPTADVSMIECNWKPSATIRVSSDWKPGAYLIKLVGGGGQRHYVPFTVRDDASHAAIVIQSSVTTWQAYNLWGGYSLYGGGSSGALSERSRIVSFDRPYRNPDQNGSGDFLGNELPFIYFAERLGLDVTYWTDVDLHERPKLLMNHKMLVSLGHDEYWSHEMRYSGVMSALASGVNVAFLGANACYRQIRLDSSPLGTSRRVVCYKDAAEDPVAATHPELATSSEWGAAPTFAPESELIGSMYQAYGADAPLVIADSSSWVFAGMGLAKGDEIHGAPGQQVVGSEFDGFEPALSGPKNLTVLAHSRTSSVGGELYSDMTYYTVARGGGVFATGTARWVQLLWAGEPALDGALSFAVSPAKDSVTAITLNVLRVLAHGPASASHPSKANWTEFYARNAEAIPSVDVP